MDAPHGSRSPLAHVLSSAQFDRAFLDYLYTLTTTIRRFDKSREGLVYLRSLLPHKRAMLYFTQPSTRTFLSFQSACHILGITASEIRDASTSSERKGESVEDSLRTFSSYVDLIIMRSPIPSLCDRIAKMLDATPRPVPIINAGSGPDEHPTQALLDMYTLGRSTREAGGIDGKT
ncbi:MAG: aspartate carbamoyltransferase, partial [Pseudomonadota bacterium]